ncbi:hypothetical protein PP1Y_Lpl1252 (plasmid) [Novosphingobium sp. PP1Y]|nr:hypothetical protein PP1Y_Lpl1252 [Novosphingobium sp. PP1Y]
MRIAISSLGTVQEALASWITRSFRTTALRLLAVRDRGVTPWGDHGAHLIEFRGAALECVAGQMREIGEDQPMTDHGLAV